MLNNPENKRASKRGYSTADHVFTLNQILEKSREYDMLLSLMFIDYNKAFDSVDHNSVVGALKNQGVKNDIIKILQKWYIRATA